MLGFCIWFEPSRNLSQCWQSLVSSFTVQLLRFICLEYIPDESCMVLYEGARPPPSGATHTCGSASGVVLFLTFMCSISVTALNQVRCHRKQWLMLLFTLALCVDMKTSSSYTVHAHCNHGDTVTTLAFQLYLILFKRFLARLINKD